MGRRRRPKSVNRNSRTPEGPNNSKSLPVLRVKISRISLALRHGNLQQAVDNVETSDFGTVAVGCDCAKVVPQERLRDDDCGSSNQDDDNKTLNEDVKPVDTSQSEKGVVRIYRNQTDDEKSLPIMAINETIRCDNERRDSGRPVRNVEVKPDSNKEQEQQQEEENDSPSEDEKDVDWTPGGIKEMRCTRRSTRVATQKAKQGIRQTRARARILTPQHTKRKRSSSGDIRKAPVSWLAPSPAESISQDDLPGRLTSDKERACIDCSLKHHQDSCPLHRPIAIINDYPVNTIDGLDGCFASNSLPKCLKLVTIDKGHGPSVMAMETIQQYTQFGPLVGQHIEEADIHEDMDLKNIWELFGSNSKHYLTTADPKSSNWLRYVRPAPCKSERNMSAITFKDRFYFVTIKDIKVGMELTYWAEDPTVSWSKKKIEKTSCGGCNQKFAHPLYYRMHCMIFHDPNYSLTIRKYHCKICGIAVLGKENIMRHASEMHEGKGAYQCQYCKKFFLRLNYLDMHRTYGCKLNPCRSRPLCDLCGKKFCQPQKLKVHIRRMHSDISEVLKEFQCKSCFKLLGSRAALQRHLKEVHHKDQNIAATCDRCGKTFQNKSNLKIHMLTHSGVKPFRCTESRCTAAFTTKQCLQFHYKKVHGYTMDSMPSIARCIAYTFESYSGGTGNDDDNDNLNTENPAMVPISQFGDAESVMSGNTTSDLDSSLCSSSMTGFPPQEDMEAITSAPSCAISPPQLEDKPFHNNNNNAEINNLDTFPLKQCKDTDAVDLTGSSLVGGSDNEGNILSTLPIAPQASPVNRLPLEVEDCSDDTEIELCEDDDDVGDNVKENSFQQQLIQNSKCLIHDSKHSQDSNQCNTGSMGDIVGITKMHLDRPEDLAASDVELESDLDNSVSQHSLELEPQVEEASHLEPQDHSDVQHKDHIIPNECLPHSTMVTAAAIAASYASLSSRLLPKDAKFPADIVAAMTCDFSVVRHYAVALAQGEYAMDMRSHSDTESNDGNLVDHNQPLNDLSNEPSAEDLSNTLSRYDLEDRSLNANVKTETGDIVDETSSLSEAVLKQQHPHHEADLIVTDEEDDNEDPNSSRDGVSTVLAQTEHGLIQYVRHPSVLSHRDIDHFPLHSLDLTVPRPGVHLLEHLAHNASHVEHLTERSLTPPEEPTLNEHMSRPPSSVSHGNLHVGQISFHGIESLPRPLPHRLEPLGHLTAPHSLDHLTRSSSPQDLEAHLDTCSPSSSHGLEHMGRSGAHSIDGIVQSSHSYVVDHLSRIPPTHSLDSFSRSTVAGSSSMELPSHAIDNLGRTSSHGMEFLSRLSPRPRQHRLEAMTHTFSYAMEHPAATTAVQTVSAASYILQHGTVEHISRPSSHASPYSMAIDQRVTTHITHSLDLSASRNGDSPLSNDTSPIAGDAVSPSYQECSPPTPSPSSYQTTVTPSSSSAHMGLPPSPASTSALHPTYSSYLEYY